MALIDLETFKTETAYSSNIATKRSSSYSALICDMVYVLGKLHTAVAEKKMAVAGPLAQRVFFQAQKFLEQFGSSTNEKQKKASAAVQQAAEGAWPLSKEGAKAAPKNTSGILKPEDYEQTVAIKQACAANGFKADKWYSQTLDVRALSLYVTSSTPGDTDELTSGGWCNGMVVHWILTNAEGKDFWEFALTDQGASAFRAQAARQALAKSDKDRLGAGVTAYKNKGLKAAVPTLPPVPCVTDPNRLNNANQIVAKPGWHHLVFGGAGSHAMAAHVDDANVTFFDPNFGQWSGPKAKFPAFFKTYVAENANEYKFVFDVPVTK